MPVFFFQFLIFFLNLIAFPPKPFGLQPRLDLGVYLFGNILFSQTKKRLRTNQCPDERSRRSNRHGNNRYRHTRQREPVRAENQRDTNRHPHINAKAIPKFLEEV